MKALRKLVNKYHLIWIIPFLCCVLWVDLSMYYNLSHPQWYYQPQGAEISLSLVFVLSLAYVMSAIFYFILDIIDTLHYYHLKSLNKSN